MKAIFRSIIFCLTLLIGLTACDDKHVKMPSTGGLDHAEKLIEGVYVGTWSSTNTATGETTTATGTVTFSSNDELGNNVVGITIISDDTKAVNLGAKSDTSACNVSKLSSDVLSFWNVYSLNPFGFTFTGKVTPEGEATLNFETSVVKNHKQTIFNVEFVGHKQ
ncbi:MAG: hypothetical protein K2L45_10545 [Muribaculaceae bacterium]|nr:hypothetical protein [Muribaculaceae bacterium]MDE6633514.1 hypothetical protein [Muribaculaceae bacterium]